MDTALIILTLVFGGYMTWNIGANDVANAMGTSVGSKALTLRKAVICAAFLEFAGAFLVGSNVSTTIQKGIINTTQFQLEPATLIFGMIAALLGTGIWLQMASYYGWPVSTTHCIVGSILGFGIVVAGPKAIHWGEIYYISLSWVLSPLMGGTLSYFVFILIQRRILFSATPLAAARILTPFFVFASFTVFGMSILIGGLKKLHLDLNFLPALTFSILFGFVAAALSALFFRTLKTKNPKMILKQNTDYHLMKGLNKSIKHLRRTKLYATGPLQQKVSDMLKGLSSASHDTQKVLLLHENSMEFDRVEKIFAYLQVLSACFVAFAHGANDVANAIGPMAAIFSTLKNGIVSYESVIPLWLLAFGGAGIVLGLMTWGWRVIETVGKKITELTPTRGFSAEISAATTILLASKLGLPISTTHTLVGAVLGVGIARGMGALNLRVLKDIIGAWVITIPAGAFFTVLTYYFLKLIFR